MFYVKNVPSLERIGRVLIGIGLLAGAVWWLGASTRGWIVGASGLAAMLTGLVGWCPMCAIAGRKISSGSP